MHESLEELYKELAIYPLPFNEEEEVFTIELLYLVNKGIDKEGDKWYRFKVRIFGEKEEYDVISYSDLKTFSLLQNQKDKGNVVVKARKLGLPGDSIRDVVIEPVF